MKPRKSGTAPVGVLTKVLTIFDLLDRTPGGLQLRSIAQLTKLNKSTAWRFLSHLEGAGYVVRDGAGAYLLGPRLVHLGAGSTYQGTICRVSQPILEELWRQTGETVNLGVLDGKEVLYLSVLESPHSFRLVSKAGLRRPLYCTALGKVILAGQPSAVRDELMAATRFEKLTPRSISRPVELIAELGRIQSRGYAIDNEEVVEGARCIAAPILDCSGYVAAAVSVSGPVSRMARARIPAIAQHVQRAGSRISASLGYKESS
ncbi:MAG TPA: IclR family transcriptional regulator [Acidobacteriaceae bacterium]|nr:IclR family transcriptional regulator [Acidobacteriaceae bacterium]